MCKWLNVRSFKRLSPLHSYHLSPSPSPFSWSRTRFRTGQNQQVWPFGQEFALVYSSYMGIWISTVTESSGFSGYLCRTQCGSMLDIFGKQAKSWDSTNWTAVGENVGGVEKSDGDYGWVQSPTPQINATTMVKTLSYAGSLHVHPKTRTAPVPTPHLSCKEMLPTRPESLWTKEEGSR